MKDQLTTPLLPIAMWSPPRARSTMMMRVFESLGCRVMDEPFYAYWLAATQKTDDPGYAATLAAHETDWRVVANNVVRPDLGSCHRSYQKHMAIHMLDPVDLSFMRHLHNCFLIRHPAEVIASMAGFRDLVPKHEADIEAAAHLVGIPQLERIFNHANDISTGPVVVIDANDVLENPTTVLGAFCQAVHLPFDTETPIQWKAGRHPDDGAWADEWYQAVYQTTGLKPYERKQVAVPAALQPVLDYCLPVYEKIARHKLGGSAA